MKIGDDPTDLSLVEDTMQQIRKCYLLCFKALDHLCRDIAGRKCRNSLVYYLVTFFNKSLDRLHDMCIMQAEYEVAEDWASEEENARVEDVAGQNYALNYHLSQNLGLILPYVDWKVGQPGHSDVLEGILFSMLDHAGRLVSEAVFGENVAESEAVGRIAVRDTVETKVTKVAVKLESRHLVLILNGALANSAQKQLIAEVLAGVSTATGNLAVTHPLALTCLTGDLLVRAKKRLQATLVKSIVGESQAAEFVDALKLPEAPNEEVLPSIEPPQAGEHGPEWLIESVWSLVGWDMVVS
jgi:hypothetical protein